MPNGPPLVATCGPLSHWPFFALARTRSMFVYSYLPPEPMGFQPVSAEPAQSSVTSWKPLFVFSRVTTRFVVGYVGSVKKTYFWRNCAGGTTMTYSSSPRQHDP